MIQFLAGLLVSLWNKFQKHEEVKPPTPKEGLRFVTDNKEYTLDQRSDSNELVDKFNKLQAAGLFNQNLSGGVGEWEYQVLARGHCVSLVHHPKSGQSAPVFIYGEHNGVLIELGAHFNKVKCIALLERFMDDLLKVLLTPSTHVKVAPVKQVQVAPEAPQTHSLRRGKKRRTVSVTKRKDNYYGPE